MNDLIRYVNPHGPLPEIAGTKCGCLLVIGSACGVWEDLEVNSQTQQDIMAVNNMMADYPANLQHGISLHPERLQDWVFRPMDIHSNVKSKSVDHVWPLTRDGGVSGCFAAIVGLLLGYESIILAGIPADASARYFDLPGTVHPICSTDGSFQEWVRLRDEVSLAKERIRSLSGKTRELFGAPND